MSLRRICYVVSSELTVRAFLLDLIGGAADRYRVSVVANMDSPDALGALGIALDVTPVRIARRIAPFADLAALVRLIRLFRRARFDLVHSLTPKAGLLAALAGAICRVPIRVHTFTGQVWVTRSGPARALLKALDRLIGALATHVLVDSASQLDFLVSEGVVSRTKARVLGHGSVCGVDAGRFRPDPIARASVRAKTGVPPEAILFLYLGRLARDKGLLDLAHAFAKVEGAWLMLVGPDEDSMAAEIRDACGPGKARLRMLGYTDRPEEFMAAADVFVLPSYREGFGSVIIEAAAAGIPAIGSRIYGVTDAIAEGETGFLVPARDPAALAARMRELASDAALRKRLGRAARARAMRDFAMPALTRATLEYYAEQLEHPRSHA